jgi:hypothetical protein
MELTGIPINQSCINLSWGSTSNVKPRIIEEIAFQATQTEYWARSVYQGLHTLRAARVRIQGSPYGYRDTGSDSSTDRIIPTKLRIYLSYAVYIYAEE